MDPNNIVLPDQKIAFILPCKVANTSIKVALAEALKQPVSMALDGPAPYIHDEDTWGGIATKFEIHRLPKEDGWLKIGFIRHPVERLISCWQDKVMGPNAFPAFSVFSQLEYQMSCLDFAKAVAQIPDDRADQHFRSQVWDLCAGSELIPDLVLSVDSADWWKTLRLWLRRHADLDIGAARHEQVSEPRQVKEKHRIADAVKGRYLLDHLLYKTFHHENPHLPG